VKEVNFIKAANWLFRAAYEQEAVGSSDFPWSTAWTISTSLTQYGAAGSNAVSSTRPAKNGK